MPFFCNRLRGMSHLRFFCLETLHFWQDFLDETKKNNHDFVNYLFHNFLSQNNFKTAKNKLHL